MILPLNGWLHSLAHLFAGAESFDSLNSTPFLFVIILSFGGGKTTNILNNSPQGINGHWPVTKRAFSLALKRLHKILLVVKIWKWNDEPKELKGLIAVSGGNKHNAFQLQFRGKSWKLQHSMYRDKTWFIIALVIAEKAVENNSHPSAVYRVSEEFADGCKSEGR